MTELDPKKNAPQQSARKATPTIKKAPKGDYLVGKGRPPLETRWQPGQSGNPRGRRKGHRNVKTELREIAFKKIMVRDGETECQLSLVGANVLAHGVKGAKGDVRSANFFPPDLSTPLFDQLRPRAIRRGCVPLRAVQMSHRCRQALPIYR